ncbi:MAG: hypothetical protein BYD32DRAFT_98700 [Podila humilis]|nr:MAG: hypothetical protein BYD32DRAFT_98700 [Podila humilis]
MPASFSLLPELAITELRSLSLHSWFFFCGFFFFCIDSLAIFFSLISIPHRLSPFRFGGNCLFCLFAITVYQSTINPSGIEYERRGEKKSSVKHPAIRHTLALFLSLSLFPKTPEREDPNIPWLAPSLFWSFCFHQGKVKLTCSISAHSKRDPHITSRKGRKERRKKQGTCPPGPSLRCEWLASVLLLSYLNSTTIVQLTEEICVV